MLKTRVLTAAVLLPLVVAGIIWLPTRYVALVLGGVLAVGAWEWGLLSRLRSSPLRVLYALATAGFLSLLYMLLDRSWMVTGGLLLVLAWWVVAVIWLVRFPRGWDLSVGPLVLAWLLGWLLLAGPFIALTVLHRTPSGPALMLWLFVLIWATDTGAYFAGRFWGRQKLAPRISPGKTRQGAYGGVAAALLVAALGAWWFGYQGLQALAFILLGGGTALVSIVGDLTVSMFKRQAGVKDSGSLFPGHGGVLDRLDSLLAAAPLFVLGLTALQS